MIGSKGAMRSVDLDLKFQIPMMLKFPCQHRRKGVASEIAVDFNVAFYWICTMHR